MNTLMKTPIRYSSRNSVNSNRSMFARATLLLRLPVMGLLPLVAAAQPACVLPPSGLVAWWRGEGNGNESAGTNNAYALPNITFTNGIVGRAFAIDPDNYPLGAYTGVRIADQPYYALTNSLSIEGWIRPRGAGYVIFYRGDNRSGLDPYGMGMGRDKKSPESKGGRKAEMLYRNSAGNQSRPGKVSHHRQRVLRRRQRGRHEA